MTKNGPTIPRFESPDFHSFRTDLVTQSEESDRTFVNHANRIDIGFQKPRGHQQFRGEAVRRYFLPVDARRGVCNPALTHAEILIDMFLDAGMKKELSEFVSDGKPLAINVVGGINGNNDVSILADNRTRRFRHQRGVGTTARRASLLKRQRVSKRQVFRRY